MAAIDWAEYTLAELKRAGHRSGGARAAIVELLARQGCCLSAQEIFEELRASERRVGIGSIYRVLDLLRQMRLVQEVDLGGGISRYERAQPNGEHHHHLVCERCGKVVAFEDERLEVALERLAGEAEYAVEAHEVVLRGVCTDCGGRSGRAAAHS